MDERKDGVAPHDGTSPRRAAGELEAEVDAIRVDLGALVGELDRRRHRARTPLLIAATTAALAALGLGTLFYVRRRPRWRHRPNELLAALRRAAAHPERVVPRSQEPSLAKKVLVSAAASAASVIARRAAGRLFASPDERKR